MSVLQGALSSGVRSENTYPPKADLFLAPVVLALVYSKTVVLVLKENLEVDHVISMQK